MTTNTVRPPDPDQGDDPDQADQNDTDRQRRELPLRWALIFAIGAAAGFAAYAAEGLVAGITTAVVVVALLHAILD